MWDVSKHKKERERERDDTRAVRGHRAGDGKVFEARWSMVLLSRLNFPMLRHTDAKRSSPLPKYSLIVARVHNLK